jgi:hypothetical protein
MTDVRHQDRLLGIRTGRGDQTLWEPPAQATVAAAALPAYDHIVVVIEENHAYGEIIGNANAPYITSLADDRTAGNRIPTVFFGAHMATGSYGEHVTHYTVLRTLESLTGLGCVANSCPVGPITDIWN